MKSEEIKIRVPSGIKLAVAAIAESRFTSDSEIVREALLAYLAARSFTPDQLRDVPANSAANAAGDAVSPARRKEIVQSFADVSYSGTKSHRKPKATPPTSKSVPAVKAGQKSQVVESPSPESPDASS